MARTSKGKPCWCGYLMAGRRSSPVLLDSRLESGSPKTIYMYNLNRDEIIEYVVEVVEKKLRDLKSDESEYIKELDAGYKKACRKFKRRGVGKRQITVSTTVSSREGDYSDDDGISNDNSGSTSQAA